MLEYERRHQQRPRVISAASSGQCSTSSPGVDRLAGLLARYQIIVLELQDPVVTPERLMGEDRRSEEVRGQRLGGLRPRGTR
ncbi:hypothetical protein AB0K74_45175 [Streptomyces sp. NPDC056159]|uniref:hypothetical protein n=1 Tax=Streptomyces sp. NPDC056159 TaxID=3155537 RepID=UPI00343DE1E5